jgi:hypothetical protein
MDGQVSIAKNEENFTNRTKVLPFERELKLCTKQMEQV